MTRHGQQHQSQTVKGKVWFLYRLFTKILPPHSLFLFSSGLGDCTRIRAIRLRLGSLRLPLRAMIWLKKGTICQPHKAHPQVSSIRHGDSIVVYSKPHSVDQGMTKVYKSGETTKGLESELILEFALLPWPPLASP